VDNNTVFYLSAKGEREQTSTTGQLSGDMKRVLTLVDDHSTVAELQKRAAVSLRDNLAAILGELESGGFIHDKAHAGGGLKGAIPKMIVATKEAMGNIKSAFDSRQPGSKVADGTAKAGAGADARNTTQGPGVERRGTGRADSHARAEMEAAKALAEADAWNRAEAEAERLRSAHEQAQARAKAEQDATAAELRKAKSELEAARAKLEAEVKARAQAEMARLVAEREAARVKANSDAGKRTDGAGTHRIVTKPDSGANAQSGTRAAEVTQTIRMHQITPEELEAQKRKHREDVRLKVEQELRDNAELARKSASEPARVADVSGAQTDAPRRRTESSRERVASDPGKTASAIPQSRLESITRILTGLQTSTTGVEASALISSDGLMIASVLEQDMDETRVAAMTATLLSLGKRAATELRRGNVSEVVVHGTQGYAMMISSGRGTLLLVLATEDVPLGLLFMDMRGAAEEIKTAI
jgi:predicted regulator of Ras-like GTPase activity (Roadblock/LC7/MglB family)